MARRTGRPGSGPPVKAVVRDRAEDHARPIGGLALEVHPVAATGQWDDVRADDPQVRIRLMGSQPDTLLMRPARTVRRDGAQDHGRSRAVFAAGPGTRVVHPKTAGRKVDDIRRQDLPLARTVRHVDHDARILDPARARVRGLPVDRRDAHDRNGRRTASPIAADRSAASTISTAARPSSPVTDGARPSRIASANSWICRPNASRK